MSLLPGISKIIKSWKQFEAEVGTLEYRLHWQHYYTDNVLDVSGNKGVKRKLNRL